LNDILSRVSTVNEANTTSAVNVVNAPTMYKFSNSLGQRDKVII